MGKYQMKDFPEGRIKVSNIQWYSDPDLIDMAHAGNNFASGKSQPGVYIYYATQTVNECQSPTTEISLTINELPSNPVITFNNGILQSDATYGNQLYV